VQLITDSGIVGPATTTTQMDEESGKVIDGTARAREWRRPRPKASADTDGVQPHSEAPKSIAASLLVPDDMPAMTIPPAASPDVDDRLADGAVTPSRNGSSSDTPVAGNENRVNLFLTHGAVEGDTPREPWGAYRQLVLAPISRCAERLVAALRVADRHRGSPLTAIRERALGRRMRIAASVLGAAVVLVVVLALVGVSAPVGQVSNQAGDKQANANLLGSLKSDAFAAFANPFSDTTAHQRVDAHRAHLATRKLSATRHPGAPARTRARVTAPQPVVTVRYAPSPSPPVDTYTAPDTQSSAAGSTTPAASQAAASQTESSEETPASHSPPAGPTGPGALLGPGHCSC
jgi:hypothetical protein